MVKTSNRNYCFEVLVSYKYHPWFSFLYKAPLRLRSCAYSVIPPPLDSEEKRMLDRFLRVDHAGEYGANRIYAGQMAVLGRSRTGPLIQAQYFHVL